MNSILGSVVPLAMFCTFLQFFPNLNQDAPKLINHWNNPYNYLIHLFGGLKLLTQGEFEKCTNKTLFFTPDSNQTQYLTLPLIFPQSIISWICVFHVPRWRTLPIEPEWPNCNVNHKYLTQVWQTSTGFLKVATTSILWWLICPTNYIYGQKCIMKVEVILLTHICGLQRLWNIFSSGVQQLIYSTLYFNRQAFS